jgi:hypothetical protein
MNLRCLILLSLMMLQKVNFGQGSSSSKLENGDMNFDLRIEYFQHLDSAFAVNHHLAEVVMYEANYDNGKLIYNEPIVKYRFDEQGRRTYIEQNYWTSIGFTSRYTTYYKDSLVNVQHEKYTYTDGNKRDSKYVFKFIRLNDSLSTSSEYSYEFDSLIRTNSKGIVNSFAENRNKLAEQNKAALVPAQIINAQEEMAYVEPHIGYSIEKYNHELKPELVKDDKGRIIEVHLSSLVYNKSQHTSVFPVKSICVSYQNEPSNVAQITCYAHWDVNLLAQFQASTGTVENAGNIGKCFSNDCIIYIFNASNFEAGIPKLIEINAGKEKVLQQRYICEIKKY